MSDRDTTTAELLHLEMDGELNAGERARLERFVRANPDAARERGELEGLSDLLSSARVAPAEDFSARVMASLPAAGWEARSPRSWGLAAALLAALCAGAVGLAAAAGGAMGPVAGAVSAVLALLSASAVAGAGLAAASWQGLGWGLSSVLAASPVNLIAFLVLVVGVNAMLVRRLRRRRDRDRAYAEAKADSSGS